MLEVCRHLIFVGTIRPATGVAVIHESCVHVMQQHE